MFPPRATAHSPKHIQAQTVLKRALSPPPCFHCEDWRQKLVPFFVFLVFMYFERERACEQGEGQREVKTESQVGSTLLAQSPMRGSISQTVRA